LRIILGNAAGNDPSPPAADDPLHRCNESIKFNRFGVEFVAPGGDRLVAFSGQCMG
jgi:hypothetical protein